MKKLWFLSILIFLCPLCLLGCGEVSEEKLSEYTLNLSYEDGILSGQEEVCYVNTSDNAFDELYFHLYPNAFREGAKNKVCSQNKESAVYYAGESYGKIDIEKVSLFGNETSFEIGGEDENILIVPLSETLFPDEEVKIEISFEVCLPYINHRLGIGQNTINFGNFYPIACVYEERIGFSQELYHSNGDPFYSECANYTLSITHPSSYKIASSGKVKESSQENGKTTSLISGEKIRDFCFSLSEKFEQVSEVVDGVEVNYYGYQGDDDLQENLRVSTEALKCFSSLFGKYPYQTLSVVKTNFLHGGMEYPNLVLISDSVQKEDFGYVIVHEIAHQWWYGVVGNDQYNHPWLDEALAEYSTLLFFEENSQYGLDYKNMIASAQKSFNMFVKVYSTVNGEVDLSMERGLDRFETEPEYVQCTYTKGVLMMDFLRQSVGREKLIKSLGKYYKTFSYKIAQPEDLIACFIKTGGGDLEEVIKCWLEGRELQF